MDEPTAPAGPDDGGQLALLRGLVTTATQRLLGDTIAVEDERWAAPSRLPGWSRAHVASHLARQAEGLERLVGWAATGERQEMYASPKARTADIEAGAGRTGLALQVDLDTTAGRLAAAFERLDEVDGWGHEVEMRGGLHVPARLLPLARLNEVVLHHVDLDVGQEVADVEPATAGWLLEWCAYGVRAREEFPRLVLRVDDGPTLALGSVGEPIVLQGSAAALLGRLTGRGDGAGVTGGEGLRLPGI